MRKERSKTGEKITNWEYSILKNSNSCPNCLSGKIKETGVISQLFSIYFCRNCGQGYSLSLNSVNSLGIYKTKINIKYQRKLKIEKLK